jgi:CheY-like chemotaxis protein
MFTAFVLPFCEPIRRVPVVIFEDVSEFMAAYVKCVSRLRRIDLKQNGLVTSPEQAIAIFRQEKPKIVITDLSLRTPAQPDGIAILKTIRQEAPRTVVALATCFSPASADMTTTAILQAGFDAVFNKTEFKAIRQFVRRKAREFSHFGPPVSLQGLRP